jgi:type IV secretory pathway component VirB8
MWENNASQLPSNKKGDYLMSKKKWDTPEVIKRRKKRNKIILYISIFVFTIISSVLATVLMSQV